MTAQRTAFTESEKDALQTTETFGVDEDGCAFACLNKLALRKRRTGFDNDSRPVFVFEVRAYGTTEWETVSWLVATNLK